MFFKRIILLVIFITTVSYSQVVDVSGVVYSEDDKFLANVEVGLVSSNGEYNTEVNTDIDGGYSFANVPYGHYTIVYSYNNFSDFKTIEVNKTNTFFKLKVEGQHKVLDNIDIVIQNKKQQLERTGYAMNVISIDNAAYQSVQTNELLDRSAGVKLRQDGGLGSKVSYNINGLSGRSVRIFIDGVPAENFGSAFSINSIPPASIERIEVYKGVVPAYLSQDALGGAINIVLKQKRTSTLNVSGSYGSFNTQQYNANGSYRAENGLTVNGTAFYNYSDNNYRVFGPMIRTSDAEGKITYLTKGAKRFNDAYESYGTQVNIGFTDVKWADKFFVGTVLSKGYKEQQHGSTMEKVYGDRHSRRNAEMLALNYDKKDFLIEGLQFKVDASYGNYTRQVIDTVGIMYDWSGKPTYDINGNIIYHNGKAEVGDKQSMRKDLDKNFALRTNLSYEFIKNNILHINYFHNKFKRSVTDPKEHPVVQSLINTRDLQKDILAISYENISFQERLRTNLFYKNYNQKTTSKEPIRVDKDNYQVKYTTIDKKYDGYGLSLSYHIWDSFYLLSSFEKAIRMPAEEELFGNSSENLLAAMLLEPEKSTNANIGFNAGPFRLGDHILSLNATYFFRDTKDMIRLIPDDARGEYAKYENLEDVLSRGVDVELNYSFRERLMFNFTVSKFDVLFNTEFNKRGEPYPFYRTQIRNEPSLKLNANLSYTFKDLFKKGNSLNVYYNVYYVEEFHRNWKNVGGAGLDIIPAQYPNDVGAMYQLHNKKTTISFDAKNIFNQHIYDNFGLQKPGRAFYLKLAHSFFN